MASDKKLLYVAVYPSGQPEDPNPKRRYHWAFLIGPEIEYPRPTSGRRCHVTLADVEGEVFWAYEQKVLRDIRVTSNLLARLVIAHVEDEDRLLEIISSVERVQDDLSWGCWSWFEAALKAIVADGKAIGTVINDWEKIVSASHKYVDEKTTAGRYDDLFDEGPRPTWDLLEDRELIA